MCGYGILLSNESESEVHVKNVFFLAALTILLSSSSVFAREPKATICRADAILAASLIYKISDPKSFSSDAANAGNPKVALKEVIDDSELWTVSWKGGGEAFVEYSVLASPTVIENVLYACDVTEVKKTIVR